MSELPYRLSFLLTFVGGVLIFWMVANRIRASRISTPRGKNWAAGLTIFVGVVAGLLGHPILVWLFRSIGVEVDVGHAGISYIASAIYNFLFAVFLAFIWRSFLGLKERDW